MLVIFIVRFCNDWCTILGICDACTSGLLSLEEELCKNIKKLDNKLLEGKCNMSTLVT